MISSQEAGFREFISPASPIRSLELIIPVSFPQPYCKQVASYWLVIIITYTMYTFLTHLSWMNKWTHKVQWCLNCNFRIPYYRAILILTSTSTAKILKTWYNYKPHTQQTQDDEKYILDGHLTIQRDGSSPHWLALQILNENFKKIGRRQTNTIGCAISISRFCRNIWNPKCLSPVPLSMCRALPPEIIKIVPFFKSR